MIEAVIIIAAAIVANLALFGGSLAVLLCGK